MQLREFTHRVAGKFHHHAVFHLQDGTTKEGYMQPNDDQFVYLTTLSGESGGAVAIADITSVEFPED